MVFSLISKSVCEELPEKKIQLSSIQEFQLPAFKLKLFFILHSNQDPTDGLVWQSTSLHCEFKVLSTLLQIVSSKPAVLNSGTQIMGYQYYILDPSWGRKLKTFHIHTGQDCFSFVPSWRCVVFQKCIAIKFGSVLFHYGIGVYLESKKS